MAKKKLYNVGGIVYSTAPDFNFSVENKTAESLPPNEQLLTIVLDKKHRGGKTVSIIKNFLMKDDEIEALAKQLKTFCGSGGSVKDKEIIIQGDHREKIFQWMVKKGFSKTRKI
ncbi:MAG TPA: translation initiation factor [Hanamia sp.]|nr:translation initiation factor [Hanamia sp.]